MNELTKKYIIKDDTASTGITDMICRGFRLDEYHNKSRPHMRAAYFAYLQNTPGSRKAIYDCMKEMNAPKKKDPAPQAVA